MIDRRSFLQLAATGGFAALGTRLAAAVPEAAANQIRLPPLSDQKTEAKETTEPASLEPNRRIGFAVVGLGHLAIDQILPAFGRSKYARPVALVSGHRDKALKLSHQYGIAEKAVYDYSNYDALAHNPEVQVIYIVLPNSLHAEFTVRGAKAGKHILCEKPMATTAADCQLMIEACAQANVRLMIGYRSQYEPLNRTLVDLVKRKELGDLREFVATNSQKQGDPTQWRLNRAMAGGGPLPDVGIYCLNAARFVSGEEPIAVLGQTFQDTDDPRFREVESTVQFMLKFPSGFTAACSASYDSHRSQFMRVQGNVGWAELNPAFAYSNLQLRVAKRPEGHDTVAQLVAEPKDQFAAELDHMAECVISNRQPHTPGEEGWQDIRVMEAIYHSAATGALVKLDSPGKTRGPDLADPS